MSDDAALLRRYSRERAEDAFAELVRRHLDGVYSAALRRVGGDSHLAEDVAQQVFAALARHAARLSDREFLAGWLYTTTRHVAANVVRTERRRKAREQLAEIMSETDVDFSSESDWSQVAPLLDAAMDQLGESDRAAILLRFVERRPFGEIGATLRVSEDAARMRVERALDKLRVLLERRGMASSSAALGVAMANHVVAAAPAGLAVSVTTTASAATSTVTTMLLDALGIMTTTKSIGLAAALVALIAALGTALYEANAHRDADATLSAVQNDHAAQLVQLGDVEKRAQQSEAEVAQLRKAVDDPRAAQAAAKARVAADAEAAKKDAEWDGVVEGKAFLVRHPEVKRLFVEFKLATTRTKNAPFLASAHLSPEQTEEFLRLMTAQSVSGFPFGPGGKMLVLSAGEDVTPLEAANRQKSLLGEEGYKQFLQFGAMNAARDVTERLASALVFSDMPLAPTQAKELVEAIASARTKPSGSKTMVTDWNVVTERAQAILTPPQLHALAMVRVQDEAQRLADKK